MASTDTDKVLAKLVRTGGLAAVCRRFVPDDARFAGLLYDAQVISGVDAAQQRVLDSEGGWRLQAALRRSGQLWVVTGEPLGSGAATPFTLDGREYRSLWWFAESLKLAEDDPMRPEVAAGRWFRRRRPRPARTGSFVYEGGEIAVNSSEHGVLVARAVEAKVQAHAHVQAALAASGRCRMTMGGPWSGALGRYMPFALMLMRWRLA